MDINQQHAERFVDWLLTKAIEEARGDQYQRLNVAPKGRFWLGRLAPETVVEHSHLGERAERLHPCEAGFRVRPSELDGRVLSCRVRMVAWKELPDAPQDPEAEKWEKTPQVEVVIELSAPSTIGGVTVGGRPEISDALAAASAEGLEAEIHAEIEVARQGPELVLTLVNVSPEEIDGLDTNLYEVELAVDVGATVPFLLESLDDSFRYDRRVAAYGVNGGVVQSESSIFMTADYTLQEKTRPDYWDDDTLSTRPDLSFRELARDPLPGLRSLSSALEDWTTGHWATDVLNRRATQEDWSPGTIRAAESAATMARNEVDRVQRGLRLLETEPEMRRAFCLSNEAFANTISIKHKSWRPFQLGFVLANLASLSVRSAETERKFLDTLRFATGGGKTETYLLFTLITAFLDRLRGKHHGITCWARFPLRMLSLQQTQRFADVLASAELIRRQEQIPGDVFALGFFVGEAGSPNRIVRQGPSAPAWRMTNAELQDPETRSRLQILTQCPFCGVRNLEIRFDEGNWALQHWCTNSACPWGDHPLPFYVVDDEIYRWLPTVVIGTLDKAASIAMQAAMRGFYGPPYGQCPVLGHGFTYAPRGQSPLGCLYPGCSERPLDLPQEKYLFSPTLRIQDELHLLRDSLGSIDSHYEALLDHLQGHSGNPPKLIASSATLAGHERQAQALYRREGRMFPVPEPVPGRSFWSQDSSRLARRYVGLAPRGVTLEYANDQLTTTIQANLRRALQQPREMAQQVGVPEQAIEGLVWAYGIGVIYGSTLKDVEAAARSFESQIPIEDLNSVTLTGRTQLDEVRTIIDRIKEPEATFHERIHLVAASSMLSHGVDLDRLNVMVMLGLPLATAEFIQTTARIGRAYPGLVFVMHKIQRERDAAVFKIFPSFIQHMDRLVDPVPITSKSRRVLELTFAGLEQGRLYGIHEPVALDRGLRQLTTTSALKRAFTQLGIGESDELQSMIQALEFDGPLDANLRQDLERYFREFYRALNDPASRARWPAELYPGGEPMQSLRDVEEQIPVISGGGRR